MGRAVTAFQDAYKEYEGLCREGGMDPKDVEDQSPDLEANRLRMCRLFRNYLAHQNDPGFLEPTPKMQTFLDGKIRQLKTKCDTVKRHVKKPDASVVNDGMKVSDAVLRVLGLKREFVLCATKDGYRVVRMTDLITAALTLPKSSKVGTVKSVRVAPVFVRPDMMYQDIDPDAVTVCTEDGTAAGRLVGFVI